MILNPTRSDKNFLKGLSFKKFYFYPKAELIAETLAFLLSLSMWL